MNATRRRRRLTRSRGFLIAMLMVGAILALQITTSVVGATLAARQSEAAALDTYGYVGDLTAERVARYAESARDVSEGTAVSIARAGADDDVETLATSMYLRLVREPQVRAIYVGWPDGRFLVVRRQGTGFVSQSLQDPAAGTMVSANYDSNFQQLGTSVAESDYDPRTRPWYQDGVNARGTVWTEPYLQFDSEDTLVSAATQARVPGEPLRAVVGADLSLDALGDVLDDLPYGEGAAAFVLSPEDLVIAAPQEYEQQLQEEAARTEAVPHATALGIEIPDVDVSDHENHFEQVGDDIVLLRTFPRTEPLDWQLYLRADEEQLSPGLGRLQGTVWWITAFSVIAVLVATLLVMRV